MNYFADVVLPDAEPPKVKPGKLGNVLHIEPEGFLQMMTNNGYHRRLSNDWIVKASLDMLQKHVSKGEAIISAVHIERESIQKIDPESRQLMRVSDEELLESHTNNLIASKAIIMLTVNNLYDDYHPSMAINISPEGEEIAFGNTVQICTNFTILQADNRFSTFQRHRDKSSGYLSLDALMKEVSGIFPKIETNLERDLKLIEELKQQKVHRDKWNMLLGELFSRIHYVNRQRLSRNIAALPAEVKNLPITSTLLAEIAAESVKPSHPDYFWDGDYSNKWNLINFGTEKIKLEAGVAPSTWMQTSANWAELIQERNFYAN